MTSNVTVASITFDYSQLGPDTRLHVEDATRRLHLAARKTAEQIIEIGKILIEVKASLPHGQFGPWLDAEFEGNWKAADRMMIVAERFGDKLDTMSNLGVTVLYALAAESTPVEVVNGFEELARLGQQFRHKDVVKAVAEHKAISRAKPIPIDAEDDYPVVDAVIVDPNTGEILGSYQESDPIPDRTPQLPKMPTPMKPTPIHDAPRGMSGVVWANAIIALTNLPPTDIDDAGYFLAEEAREGLDGLLAALPEVFRTIERIRDRAIQVRLKQDKVG